jgi:hypothetical protein
MKAQGLVRDTDGWARVERSPSSRSRVESPLNHHFFFFFFNFMPHPTVVALNLILCAIFRGWHQRHPIGIILDILIIARIHRILFFNFCLNAHVTLGVGPMHNLLGMPSRRMASGPSFTYVNITLTFLPSLKLMRT